MQKMPIMSLEKNWRLSDMSKKSVFFLSIVFSLLPVSLFAVTKRSEKPTGDEPWYILKQAQNCFENNDYGEAVKFAEDAKQKRLEYCQWESYILDQTQRSQQIRKAGDYIDEILLILQEKSYVEAVQIINEHFDRYGKDFFNSSFSKLKQWIENDYLYPEADFLLGKIYKLEGEFEFSASYLNRAYENRQRLDVPDVKYDILYELADLSELQGDDKRYEENLLSVLKDDSSYTNSGFLVALTRLINNNTKDSVEKFFLLYRSNNDISIRALYELGEYYTRMKQNEKALRCVALGSIAAVTKIEDILKNRLFDYSYTTFQDLLDKASKYDDVVEWGNSNNIWELFYNLAANAEISGKTVFSKTLFSILAEHEPEDYWKKRAAIKLQ